MSSPLSAVHLHVIDRNHHVADKDMCVMYWGPSVAVLLTHKQGCSDEVLCMPHMALGTL